MSRSQRSWLSAAALAWMACAAVAASALAGFECSRLAPFIFLGTALVWMGIHGGRPSLRRTLMWILVFAVPGQAVTAVAMEVRGPAHFHAAAAHHGHFHSSIERHHHDAHVRVIDAESGAHPASVGVERKAAYTQTDAAVTPAAIITPTGGLNRIENAFIPPAVHARPPAERPPA